MKKQTLLLMAAGVLALGACNSNTGAGAGANTDSLVNARVDSMYNGLIAKNDSTINALAMIKADSIVNAKKGGAPMPAHTPTRATGKENTPPPPVTPKPTGGLHNQSDQNNNGAGGLHNQSDQNQTKRPGGLHNQSDQNASGR